MLSFNLCVLLTFIVASTAIISKSVENSENCCPAPRLGILVFLTRQIPPRKIGNVCKNSTAPFTADNGIILNSTSCSSLDCPAGYKCERPQGATLFDIARYVVCCNASYSERIDDLERCPNANAALSVPGKEVILWGEDCAQLNESCVSPFGDDENDTSSLNYSCLESRFGAKCCPDTWKLASKKHCPIGQPLREVTASRDQTCGIFFREKGDDEECPQEYKCIERESRAYCCAKPPPLQVINLVADGLNPACMNATDELIQCFEDYGLNTTTYSETLGQLNVHANDITGFSQRFLRETHRFRSHIAIGSKHFANITREALFNFSSAEHSLLHLKCANYDILRSCINNVTYSPPANWNESSCGLVEFIKNMSTTVLDVTCQPENFDELLASLECLVNTTDANEEGIIECAIEMGEEIAEDLSFGFEYVFASICPSLRGFFGCLAKPMTSTCGADGEKHAKFLQTFFTNILSVVFGSC